MSPTKLEIASWSCLVTEVISWRPCHGHVQSDDPNRGHVQVTEVMAESVKSCLSPSGYVRLAKLVYKLSRSVAKATFKLNNNLTPPENLVFVDLQWFSFSPRCSVVKVYSRTPQYHCWVWLQVQPSTLLTILISDTLCDQR